MVTETIARGAAVSISHLHHAFTLGKQAVPVLENISLQLRPGKAWRCWALPAAVNQPCCGCWRGWKRRRADRCRSTARRPAPRAGADPVFQDPTLYPWLTVRQNVLLGPQAQGKKGLEAKADALIDRIGLQAFSEACPRQLSGGMARRAALARALLNEPRLLLLDEPLGKLDSLTRISMQRELIALWQQQGYTSLLVTHDIEEALLLCERVLVMSPRPGRIIAEFALPLAFPRHRDNPQLLQHRQDILRILGQEADLVS